MRYFYQLDGEGIRYEWVAFLKMIAAVAKGATGEEALRREGDISRDVTRAICKIFGTFERCKGVRYLKTN